MAKLVHLEIKNFRGIKNLSLQFSPENPVVCLIGRGDSCKTTILEAISAVLSSSWNLSFYDADFHDCAVDTPIEIEAALIDFPEKMLSEDKFGLHIRAFHKETHEIIDDVALDSIEGVYQPLLTIRLTVDSSLEPKWVVTNQREQTNKNISAADRSLLNCYMVSDYVDRHFSWNKGNPLYALLKSNDQDDDSDNGIILEALRLAKNRIDENGFEKLSDVTKLITEQAAALGLDLTAVQTTLDVRELSVKDGRVSLHENSIPFRLKGKGSRRLASFAIQSALVRNGGIMLVDEIEQGLEPDRIKQVVRTLKHETHAGQVFLTTHSREAITELAAQDLTLLVKEKSSSRLENRYLGMSSEDLQATIRACPEAFFAKKVIVCEGATEVGLCRALDKWRLSSLKDQMSFKDCAYVDGTGNALVQRVNEISSRPIQTSILCDSDDTNINARKDDWQTSGVTVFDCESNLCLEEQVFKDLPWEGVKELVSYARKAHYNDDTSLKDSVKTRMANGTLEDGWINSESDDLRAALGKTAKEKEWLKRIDHGEFLGTVIFKYWNQMGDDCHLKAILNNLSNWIDE